MGTTIQEMAEPINGMARPAFQPCRESQGWKERGKSPQGENGIRASDVCQIPVGYAMIRILAEAESDGPDLPFLTRHLDAILPQDQTRECDRQ